MKTKCYPNLRALTLFAIAGLLLGPSAFAQNAFPHDPHDPAAYESSGTQKSSATPGLLLSKVNYTTRQDTLSAYDSSRIAYASGGSRITERRTYRSDGLAWTPFDRFTYSYDGSGLNDQTLYEFWDPLKAAYFPVARYNYAHDAAGNKTQLFYEVWNVSTGGYRNGLRENYNYDAAGSITAIQQQVWSVTSTAWENSNFETMGYNPQGKQMNYLIQTWNLNLAAWENKRQTLISYDASGTVLTQAEDFTWGGPSLGWRHKSRTSNTVAAGKITQQLIENYDYVRNDWVPTTKETMTYLGSGMLGTSVMAAWMPSSGNFADQTQAGFTYNSDDQPKRVMTLVRAHGSWAVTTGAGETIYYYEGEKPPIQVNVGMYGMAGADLVLSPVPAYDRLSVQYRPSNPASCELTVSDMSGRAVLQQRAAFDGLSPVLIDVRQLVPGTYSLSVQEPHVATVSKLFTVTR